MTAGAESSNYVNEPKVYLLREMIESPAYRSLSRVGVMLLIDFMGKRRMVAAGRRAVDSRGNSGKRWVCENNGRILFPYTEGEKKGFSRIQFRNGIDELQAKGFIDITHMGKGGRKPVTGDGDATTYLIDDRWREFNEDAKVAVAAPKKPRRKDTRKDRGFQQYWESVRKLRVFLFTVDYYNNRLPKILKARRNQVDDDLARVERRLEQKMRIRQKNAA